MDIYIYIYIFKSLYDCLWVNHPKLPTVSSINLLGIKNHCSRALQLTKYILDSYHIWFPLWKSYSNPISIWSTWGLLTFLKPSNGRISKFRHPHSGYLPSSSLLAFLLNSFLKITSNFYSMAYSYLWCLSFSNINRVQFSLMNAGFSQGYVWHTLFSLSVMSDSLQLHRLQQARLPCPLPSAGACSNSHPLSQWRHPTISTSFIPFSSCLQSFLHQGKHGIPCLPWIKLLTLNHESVIMSSQFMSSEITFNVEEACTLYEMLHGVWLFIHWCLFPKEDILLCNFPTPTQGI